MFMRTTRGWRKAHPKAYLLLVRSHHLSEAFDLQHLVNSEGIIIIILIIIINQ